MLISTDDIRVLEQAPVLAGSPLDACTLGAAAAAAHALRAHVTSAAAVHVGRDMDATLRRQAGMLPSDSDDDEEDGDAGTLSRAQLAACLRTGLGQVQLQVLRQHIAQLQDAAGGPGGDAPQQAAKVLGAVPGLCAAVAALLQAADVMDDSAAQGGANARAALEGR